MVTPSFLINCSPRSNSFLKLFKIFDSGREENCVGLLFKVLAK